MKKLQKCESIVDHKTCGKIVFTQRYTWQNFGSWGLRFVNRLPSYSEDAILPCVTLRNNTVAKICKIWPQRSI